MKEPVSETRKKERAALLKDTDSNLRETYAARFYGSVQPVLWERFENGMCSGLTPHYLHITEPGEAGMLNDITTVELNAGNIDIKNDS